MVVDIESCSYQDVGGNSVRSVLTDNIYYDTQSVVMTAIWLPHYLYTRPTMRLTIARRSRFFTEFRKICLTFLTDRV